jgi:hypothetical protein
MELHLTPPLPGPRGPATAGPSARLDAAAPQQLIPVARHQFRLIPTALAAMDPNRRRQRPRGSPRPARRDGGAQERRPAGGSDGGRANRWPWLPWDGLVPQFGHGDQLEAGPVELLQEVRQGFQGPGSFVQQNDAAVPHPAHHVANDLGRSPLLLPIPGIDRPRHKLHSQAAPDLLYGSVEGIVGRPHVARPDPRLPGDQGSGPEELIANLGRGQLSQVFVAEGMVSNFMAPGRHQRRQMGGPGQPLPDIKKGGPAPIPFQQVQGWPG